MKIRRRCGIAILLAGLLTAVVFSSQTAANTVKLGSYNVDIQQTSLSGISSGGYMSVQMHLIYSSMIKGVGVFAGGPYDCAQNSAIKAVQVCMPGQANAATSIGSTEQAWADRKIDNPANLADDKIWLFSGYNDGVVKQPTMDELYKYYNHYTDAGNIFYKDTTDAGHAQITVDYGTACDFTGKEFINDCDYDGAGQLLQYIYGKLNPKQTKALSGKVIQFDQDEFVEGESWLAGMSHYGYLYVPATCAAGESCKVHVAFHGCEQYATKIGNAFYEHAGYNEWADTNNLIVLYPQTVATTLTPFNPHGCWDWWGYTTEDYATKDGWQTSAVRAMLERLAAGYRPEEPAKDTFGVPQNVTAADSAVTFVALFWTPNHAAPGFNIYRSTKADGDFSKVNQALVQGASFADSALEPKTRYFYSVAAVGPDGESARSEPVSIATTSAPPPCDPYYADNVSHTIAGRAYVLGFSTFAKGSDDPMGLWNINVETNLYKDGDVYRVGTCPAH